MDKVTKFQDCWEWPDEVTEFFEEKIDENGGYSLKICAGNNPIGDENIDLDPQQKNVSMEDMRRLPYENNKFDIVVMDPPWGISYYRRFRPFFEAVRVTKPKGVIYSNATWVPESSNTELEALYVRQDDEFSDASLITKHTKQHDNVAYEKNYLDYWEGNHGDT